MHTRFCCHTGGPILVHWYQIPAAWTLSFRKRLYCHFRRNFWESLRIDDRYQMIFIAFYAAHLFYQLPDAPQPSSVDHISCLRRTLPPLLPFWCMNPYDMPTRLVEIKGSRRRAPLDCTIVDTVGVPFHRHPSRSRLRMHQAPPSLLLATIVTTAAIAMLLFTSTIQQQLYLSQSAEGGRHQVDFKLGGLCSSPLKGPTLGPTLRPRAREKGRP